jgi:serine/threonine protein kinase
MAARHSTDRQTFLNNLLQSGLLTASELTDLAGRLPETPRGRVVARFLVEQGLLTKFQAERLLAGRTHGFVLGQYRILDQIGKGGMGRVFKAVHQTMNRVVALKILAPQLVETEKAQLMFLREMRAVARLTHPNLVTAYDANQIGDRYYLVMEYVDGPNLDRLVRDQGPLPPGLACELIRQAAEGLQYAADMGMVHRDIKPSNLLVLLPGIEPHRKRWTLKILDFGLARLQGRDDDAIEAGTIVTRPNMVLGTPDFVSPEQARDLHAADIRSDLYSLGCTFYYLLTGRVPFPEGSMLEKLIQHSTVEPEPLERLRPEVPAAVAAVVRRLMAKEPRARFQTPAELVNALEPLAELGPTLLATPRPTAPVVDDEAVLPVAESDDSLLPPMSGRDSGFDFTNPPPAGDELAALNSTLPPDFSPTAISDPGLAGESVRRPRSYHDRQRVKLAIGVAVGLVGGLVALVSLLSLL